MVILVWVLIFGEKCFNIVVKLDFMDFEMFINYSYCFKDLILRRKVEFLCLLLLVILSVVVDYGIDFVIV